MSFATGRIVNVIGGIACGKDDYASLAVPPVFGAAADRIAMQSVGRINGGLGAPAATDNPCAFLPHVVEPFDDRKLAERVRFYAPAAILRSVLRR